MSDQQQQMILPEQRYLRSIIFLTRNLNLLLKKYNSIKPINNNRTDFDCKVSRDKLIRSALNILAMSPPRFPEIEKKTIILNKMPEADLLFKIL